MAVGRTAGAVSGLAELGVVHRLTRGRLWIGLLATLLVGIVALNVLALSFNSTSSKASRQTQVMSRQNSTLQAKVASEGVSNERVQGLASNLGMSVPEPGSIGYVKASSKNAAIAAKRLESGAISPGAPVTGVPASDSTATTYTSTPATTTATVAAAPTTTTPTTTPTTATATTASVTVP
jgi:cell division septation protein DedD